MTITRRTKLAYYALVVACLLGVMLGTRTAPVRIGEPLKIQRPAVQVADAMKVTR